MPFLPISTELSLPAAADIKTIHDRCLPKLSYETYYMIFELSFVILNTFKRIVAVHYVVCTE